MAQEIWLVHTQSHRPLLIVSYPADLYRTLKILTSSLKIHRPRNILFMGVT